MLRTTIRLCLLITAAFYASATLASGTMNFTTMMPEEFQFCGKKVARGSAEYETLWNWFSNNTTGWYESGAEFELELVYESPTMRVNLTKTRVIVSYAGAGSVGQLVKAAKTSGFKTLCNQ